MDTRDDLLTTSAAYTAAIHAARQHLDREEAEATRAYGQAMEAARRRFLEAVNAARREDTAANERMERAS